jgi:hypothetical protein
MYPLSTSSGLKAVVTVFLGCMVCRGAVIFDSGVTALSPADPTQFGRISRDGVTSDWSVPKTFPGTINPTTPYTYQTYSVFDQFFKYVQVTFDSVAIDTFSAAYLGTYDPTNQSQSYLGDPGFSGNFFGTDPLVFQVVVPIPNNVVILVNETDENGVGAPFHIIVEGFTNTNFDDTITPEPSAQSLAAIGLTGLLALAYKGRRSD